MDDGQYYPREDLQTCRILRVLVIPLTLAYPPAPGNITVFTCGLAAWAATRYDCSSCSSGGNTVSAAGDCYQLEGIAPVVEVKPEDLQDVKQEPADETDSEHLSDVLRGVD